MTLTKLERNKIYEAIERSGANPKEFELAEPNVDPLLDRIIKQFQVVVITHNSGSVFSFREGRRGGSTPYAITDHPTYEVSSAVIDGQNLNFSIEHDFDHLAECINRWAVEVNRTNQAPDLWAEMPHAREMIVDIQQTDSGNAPFTEDEQRQIAAQLHEITKLLKEQLELTEEQAELVDQWRDESTEASKRMGRKDWRTYFLGTITELVIAATLPPGVGERIFTTVVHGLIYLFTGGPPQIIA